MRSAFAAKDDQAAIKALTELHGVGVAVASAILAWCFPDRWPVIDRHAWRALAEFGVLPFRLKPNNPFLSTDYSVYCEALRPVAAQLGLAPQKLDAWFYSFSKCGLSADDI